MNPYCPGLPEGALGVNDVLLLAGQSVVTREGGTLVGLDEEKLGGPEDVRSPEPPVLGRSIAVGALLTL